MFFSCLFLYNLKIYHNFAKLFTHEININKNIINIKT